MLHDAEEILGKGEDGDEKSGRFDRLWLSLREADLPLPPHRSKTSPSIVSAFNDLVCRMADLPGRARPYAAYSKDMGVV